MNLPDFLIIGETKCGTTSLYNYLIKHPKIIDTKGNDEKYDKSYNTKEIRFFDRFYNKGVEWYKNCFNKTKSDEITGEATPMYFYRTITIQRILKHIPDVKLIVLLRNPVDRLYSNFYHNYRWVDGWKNKYPDFNIFWNSVHDPDYYLIDKGLYYFTFIKWFEFFKKEQFYIMKSEDLYKNLQHEYSQLLKFLEVDNYIIKGITYYRKNNYPPLNKELRKKVENFYSRYNKKLVTLLGDKFNWEY